MRRSVTRTTRFLLAAAAAAVVATLAGACGDDASDQRPPDTPTVRAVDSTEALAFMAAVDQSEVQTAQIGTRRANATEVRLFAQLMWREHAQSGRNIAELARQMEVDLRSAAPQSPMIANLRTTSQQTAQRLGNMSRSAEFDRAYVESQVRAHQALIQDLRRIVGSGQASDTSIAPGGGVDVGITGRPDVLAAGATADARRAANRRPETARDAARIMLAQAQQHLARARQMQAQLASGAR
jgi:predicted outer membrane protein